MARTVFLFWTVCKDDARSQELSDWYDNVHIPDVVAVPGFTSCVRYRVTDRNLGAPGATHTIPADYLSIVESEDDIETATRNLLAATADWRARGRMSNLFRVVESAIVAQENPPARQ